MCTGEGMAGITCTQLDGLIGKPGRAGESGRAKVRRRTRNPGSGMAALLSGVENVTAAGADGQDKGR